MTRIGALLLLFVIIQSSFALQFGNAHRVANVNQQGFAAGAYLLAVVPVGDGFVAFTSYRGTMIGTPIDRFGHPQRQFAKVIQSGPGIIFGSAAATADGVLVAWTEISKSYFQFLRADLSPKGDRIALTHFVGSLACNASGCAAFSGADLTLIRNDGSVVSTVSVQSAPNSGGAITALDSGFVLAWRQATVHVAFTDDNGRITATADVPTTYIGGALSVAVAKHPAGAVVVWSEPAGLYAATIAPSGQILSTNLVATLPSMPGAVSVDSNGNNYLIAASAELPFSGVFFEGIIGPSELYAIRMTSNLEKNGDIFPVSTLTAFNEPVAVTHLAGDFLIGWHHGPGISSVASARVALVDSAGHVAKPNGDAVAVAPADQGPVALATSADRYLAIWYESESEGRKTLKAARVDRFGGQLDPGGIPLGPGNADGISAASDGNSFAVTWYETLDNSPHVVFAAIDGRTGAVQKKTIVNTAARSRIAWDGSAYLLAIGGGPALGLMRLAPDGNTIWSVPVLSTFPISVAVAAIPGRTILAWYEAQTPAVVIALFDDQGREISRHEVARGGVNTVTLSSNQRDAFLLVTRISGNDFAVRFTADGRRLDGPQGSFGSLVETHGSFLSPLVAPFQDHWLILDAFRAIEFPSGLSTTIDSPYVADLAPLSDGKAAILESQVSNGTRIAVILEVGPQSLPPRRRSVVR